MIGRPILAAALSAILAYTPWGQALAGGEEDIRYPDRMDGASCGGRLVERWAVYGNTFGFAGDYLVACLLAPTKAEWVLIAGVACYKSQGIGRKCRSKKLDAFADLTLGSYENRAARPPYTHTVRLLKFGFGRTCAVRSQSYTVAPDKDSGGKPESGAYHVWSCANIRIVDKSSLLDTASDIKPALRENHHKVGNAVQSYWKPEAGYRCNEIHAPR